MTSDTFYDVKVDDWFYHGIKVSYDLGILNGMSGDIVLPNGTVSWDQAVTIAVRVRSGYLSEDIPGVDGPWYMPYVAYAES